MRMFDEDRYIEAATLMVQINALPYSQGRLALADPGGSPVRARGRAETVEGTLALLDDLGIDGELVVREARSERVEVVQMWGAPRVRSPRVPAAGATSRHAMARVALLSSDLLFGSKLQGALQAAGHEVVAPGDGGAELLVVDLTTDPDERIEQSRAAGLPRLGFYPRRAGRAPESRGGGLRAGGAALAHGARGRHVGRRRLWTPPATRSPDRPGAGPSRRTARGRPCR